jgi:hypothetical protein
MTLIATALVFFALGFGISATLICSWIGGRVLLAEHQRDCVAAHRDALLSQLMHFDDVPEPRDLSWRGRALPVNPEN